VIFDLIQMMIVEIHNIILIITSFYISGKREHEYEVIWEGNNDIIMTITTVLPYILQPLPTINITIIMLIITITTTTITTTTTIGQLKENSWLTRTELKDMGYEKLMNQKDEQIAMESMLGQRKLTTGN